jgi:hypothetical protein
MKYLKRFNESFPGDNIEATISNGNIFANDDVRKLKVTSTIYDPAWEKLLPETMTIYYHDKNYSFKKGNIMLLGDLIEIGYDSNPENPWGCPDLLEFDIYFTKDNDSNKIRMTVDITYGDLMACEFSLEAPNKINVIEYTSYHSKFDPSNTAFALENESLDAFISFLNKFDGIKISREDTKFLDKYDNYKPKLFPDDVHDMTKVDNANDNSNK